MGRLADRTAVRVAIFAVLALVVVWPLLSHAPWLNEFRDAQIMELHERAAVSSLKDYGQLPLWDPWYCGGLYGLGAPQSRFTAPTYLLSLVFGVERAEPTMIFFLVVLGMEGTFRWVRLRVNDATAAMRIAPIFALSGHFAIAWYRGWINFYGFELVPFVLLGLTLAARGRVYGVAISAIAFATILGFGGTFAAPLIAVAAVAESLRALAETPPSRRVRATFMLIAAASFMVTVAALRLLPIAEVLSAQPRIMAGTPGSAPLKILYYLVRGIRIGSDDTEDYGLFYVGPAFLILIALGGAERRSLRPLAIVIAFLWLSAGYARKPALFALLRTLPVLSALRYPERFLWLAILFACEPAANALAKVPRLGEGRAWRQGAHFVLTACVVISLAGQVANFWHVDAHRDIGAVAADSSAPFRQSRGNRWIATHYQAINLGSLSCWETHPVTMSSLLRGDLAQEEYLADPTAGEVRRVSWSPNAIVLHASLSRPARVLINQNWHPGWRASVGNVVSQEGLLAIDAPAGDADITVTFKPNSARVGGLVTLSALAALLFMTLNGRRVSTLRIVSAMLVPWGVLAALVATWTEPRYPPAPMRNPNESPAFMASIPDDATKLGAQFDVPVVVDAVKVEGPDRLRNLALDLWLRRTGPIPRTTGMFVHVKRRDGDPPPNEPGKDKYKLSWNADHQVIGGSFYLSDAPQDRLVHDAFGVHLSHAAKGQYDVWLGFGHVSGRKGHDRVIESGGAPVEDDLVRIGSFVLR